MSALFIEQISPHGFRVKSERTCEWYTVIANADINKHTCDCNDFTFKGWKDKHYKCKHINAVLELVAHK